MIGLILFVDCIVHAVTRDIAELAICDIQRKWNHYFIEIEMIYSWKTLFYTVYFSFCYFLYLLQQFYGKLVLKWTVFEPFDPYLSIFATLPNKHNRLCLLNLTLTINGTPLQWLKLIHGRIPAIDLTLTLTGQLFCSYIKSRRILLGSWYFLHGALRELLPCRLAIVLQGINQALLYLLWKCIGDGYFVVLVKVSEIVRTALYSKTVR